MDNVEKNEVNEIVKRLLRKNRRLDREMLRGDYLKYKMSDLFRWKFRDHALPDPEKRKDKTNAINLRNSYLALRGAMQNALTNLMDDVDYKGIAVASYMLFGQMVIYESLWTNDELRKISAERFKKALSLRMFAKKAGVDSASLQEKDLIPYPLIGYCPLAIILKRKQKKKKGVPEDTPTLMDQEGAQPNDTETTDLINALKHEFGHVSDFCLGAIRKKKNQELDLPRVIPTTRYGIQETRTNVKQRKLSGNLWVSETQTNNRLKKLGDAGRKKQVTEKQIESNRDIAKSELYAESLALGHNKPRNLFTEKTNALISPDFDQTELNYWAKKRMFFTHGISHLPTKKINIIKEKIKKEKNKK